MMKRLGIIIFGMATVVVLSGCASDMDQAVASESASEITMVDEGRVAPDGLWLTRRRFGQTLTPKGPCIKVHKGYIFVTRYQGGMDNRSVWLSRKKMGEGEWKHISFPHRHVMFRGDKHLPENEKRGDAHNNIALGICPKDDTVHLLYDMHAYRPSDFATDFFNYNISKKGAATVSDDEWTSDLFYPKQNYLNKTIAEKKPATYHRVTYPGFFTTSEGDLMVKWRVGGHTNASMHLTKYDGSGWGESMRWNNGKGEFVTGYYGDFRVFNGRMVSCWHRRLKADHEIGYINNRGLYLAFCEDDTGLGEWTTSTGESMGFLLTDLEPFKIGEPSKPGENINQPPSFAVTQSGAFHARVAVDNVAHHWYRATPESEPKMEMGIPVGDMYASGDRVYVIGLDEGRPVIMSTREGAHDWKEEFRVTDGLAYSHGESILVDRATIISWKTAPPIPARSTFCALI